GTGSVLSTGNISLVGGAGGKGGTAAIGNVGNNQWFVTVNAWGGGGGVNSTSGAMFSGTTVTLGNGNTSANVLVSGGAGGAGGKATAGTIGDSTSACISAVGGNGGDNTSSSITITGNTSVAVTGNLTVSDGSGAQGGIANLSNVGNSSN